MVDLEKDSNQLHSHGGDRFFLLSVVEKVVELGYEMIVDERCDLGGGGGEDRAVIHVFFGHVYIDQIEEVLHTTKPNVILVRFQYLPHQVGQQVVAIRFLELFCDVRIT
jgi:hypothetical protein